jgi:Tol biopolymer transport system component
LALSPQGTTAYFNRTTADRSRIMALQSRFVSGRWQDAVPVPFADSAYRDLDLFVAPAGARMFFSSNRPLTGVSPKSDLDTWYVDRQGAGWSAPIRLSGVANSPAQDVFVSITGNGTLYFASDRGGNNDIYRAVPTEGGYSEVERLPGVVNTSGSESNPLIAPDESFLIFVAERSGGLGAADLYVSHRRNGEWMPARNLGALVNSSYADFAPSLSPDRKYLFFTSERPGIVADSVTGRRPGDIYRAELSAVAAMR